MSQFCHKELVAGQWIYVLFMFLNGLLVAAKRNVPYS